MSDKRFRASFRRLFSTPSLFLSLAPLHRRLIDAGWRTKMAYLLHFQSRVFPPRIPKAVGTDLGRLSKINMSATLLHVRSSNEIYEGDKIDLSRREIIYLSCIYTLLFSFSLLFFFYYFDYEKYMLRAANGASNKDAGYNSIASRVLWIIEPSRAILARVGFRLH